MLLSDKCSRSGSYKLIGQFCCNVNTTFASELTSVLDEAIRISEKVICTGDLHFDTMNPPKITKKREMSNGNLFIYDISNPTRISTYISTYALRCCR